MLELAQTGLTLKFSELCQLMFSVAQDNDDLRRLGKIDKSGNDPKFKLECYKSTKAQRNGWIVELSHHVVN